MATRQGKDKTALVQCEKCGEYYSVTYKSCPFCDGQDDYDDEYDEAPRRRGGGKRLVTNTRGGGYGRGWTPGRIIITILSIAVIIAAIYIVLNGIKPLIDRGKLEPTPSNVVEPTPSTAPTITPSAMPTPSVLPTPSTDPSNLVEPGVTPTPPAPTPSQIPSTQTATGFTLNRSDFTMSRVGETWNLNPKFTPAGSVGFIEEWTSSNTAVATVSDSGVVTAVGRGVCTVTATMAGGVKQSCVVRCTFAATGSAPSTAPSASPTPTPSGTLTLSRSDFTMSKQGETWRLIASGVSGEVSWSISNTSVATISADGLVTAVGKGVCTVTATCAGQSAKCIVRVNFG